MRCHVLNRTARSGHKGLLVQKQGAYKPNKYCMTPLFYVTAFRSMCSGGIGGGGWGTRPSRKSRNGAARPPARIEMPEKRAPKRAQCHAIPDCVALRPVCTAFLGFVPHSLGNGPRKWTVWTQDPRNAPIRCLNRAERATPTHPWAPWYSHDLDLLPPNRVF